MEQGVSTLEVRSSRDGAWYAAKPVLEPSLHPTLLPPPLHLRFEDYGPEEDEIWAVKRFSSVAALRKHMRPVSNIMQDDQCPFIHQGLLLCVACDGPGIHGFPFYDAVVCEVDRTEHTINAQGGEECNCIFVVEWENGPLRRKKSYVKCGQICFISEKNIEDDPTVRSYIEAVKSSSLKGGKFLKDSIVVNNTKESNDDEPLCTMMKIKGKMKFKESGVAQEFRTASILKNQKTRKSFINKSVGKSCGNKGKALEDTLRSKKYKKQRLRCMLSWEELKRRKTEANFSLPSVVDAKIPLITVEAELSTGIKNLSKDFNAEELKYPCNPAKEETSRPWIISRVYGNFLHQDFPRVCAVPDLFEGGHQQKGLFEKNTSRGLHLVYRDSSIYDQIKQRVKAFLYHQRELGLCHLKYMQTEEKLHVLHL